MPVQNSFWLFSYSKNNSHGRQVFKRHYGCKNIVYNDAFLYNIENIFYKQVIHIHYILLYNYYIMYIIYNIIYIIYYL